MNSRVLVLLGVLMLSTAGALLQTYPEYKTAVESFAFIAGLASSILSILFFIRQK